MSIDEQAAATDERVVVFSGSERGMNSFQKAAILGLLSNGVSVIDLTTPRRIVTPTAPPPATAEDLKRIGAAEAKRARKAQIKRNGGRK